MAFKLVHAPVASRLQPQTRPERSFRRFFIWGAEGGGGGLGTFVLRRVGESRARGGLGRRFFFFRLKIVPPRVAIFPGDFCYCNSPLQQPGSKFDACVGVWAFFHSMIRRTARFFLFLFSIWFVEVCRRVFCGAGLTERRLRCTISLLPCHRSSGTIFGRRARFCYRRGRYEWLCYYSLPCLVRCSATPVYRPQLAAPVFSNTK